MRALCETFTRPNNTPNGKRIALTGARAFQAVGMQ